MKHNLSFSKGLSERIKKNHFATGLISVLLSFSSYMTPLAALEDHSSDPANCQSELTLSHGKTFALAAKYSTNGSYFVTGASDGDVRVWNAKSGVLKRELRDHKNAVNAVAISQDSQWIATGDRDGVIKLWFEPYGTLVWSNQSDEGSITGLAFLKDGLTLVSTGDTGDATVWGIPNARKLFKLKSSTAKIKSMIYSQVNNKLYTTASNTLASEIQVWTLPSFSNYARLKKHQTTTFSASTKIHLNSGSLGQITSLNLSPDGQTLLTAMADAPPQLWDIQTGKKIASLGSDNVFVTTSDWSQDGTKIALGTVDGTAQIWDAIKLVKIESYSVPIYKDISHYEPYSWISVSLSPDGSGLLSGGWQDHMARVWQKCTPWDNSDDVTNVNCKSPNSGVFTHQDAMTVTDYLLSTSKLTHDFVHNLKDVSLDESTQYLKVDFDLKLNSGEINETVFAKSCLLPGYNHIDEIFDGEMCSPTPTNQFKIDMNNCYNEQEKSLLDFFESQTPIDGIRDRMVAFYGRSTPPFSDEEKNQFYSQMNIKIYSYPTEGMVTWMVNGTTLDGFKYSCMAFKLRDTPLTDPVPYTCGY